MCLGFVVTAISAVGCAPVPDRSTQTVDYYTGHAQERQAMLKECTNNPGDLANSPNCINAMVAARLAGQGSLRTLPPLQLPQTHSSDGAPKAAFPTKLADVNERSPSRIKED
ncbi:MAG: EexN family lipoprotein [Pseudomonadota bacterium]|nr:EexN family lipoprotein [Pseudomonadota bacterium]